uniref:PDZ domain-containing protein n=1 Tax=Periophthalmus magnuspinnatus TaxID=409849 RepID=A0A3B4AQB9_9GOBI
LSFLPLVFSAIFLLFSSPISSGLGFSIRGGAEHGVGIYVSLVEPGSFAEREGLRVGDQIVTVNDMMFDGVTHIEAVKVRPTNSLFDIARIQPIPKTLDQMKRRRLE